jgi:hypothetical protein
MQFLSRSKNSQYYSVISNSGLYYIHFTFHFKNPYPIHIPMFDFLIVFICRNIEGLPIEPPNSSRVLQALDAVQNRALVGTMSASSITVRHERGTDVGEGAGIIFHISVLNRYYFVFPVTSVIHYKHISDIFNHWRFNG